MAPMDRPKRMLVRTSLVAGSTVATLIGAQTLITVDQQNFALKAAANTTIQVQAQNTALPQKVQQVQATVTQAVVHALPTIQIVHVAPSITIVRQSGQANNQVAQIVASQPTVLPTQIVIKPPVPVQVAAPAPIIVQQPSVQASSGSSGGGGGQQASAPTTHSSR